MATEVGTPTVAVQVVPAPGDADRVTDQLSENLHRAPMRGREVRDGIEQLSLYGVSAAQIAKRTAIKRDTEDAALRVTRNPSTRERMDGQDMTLADAAIFADFEHDEAAVVALTDAHRLGRSLQRTCSTPASGCGTRPRRPPQRQRKGHGCAGRSDRPGPR